MLKAEITTYLQKLGERHNTDPSPQFSEKNQPGQCLGFGLVASRAVRQWSSVSYSPQSVVLCHSGPGTLTQTSCDYCLRCTVLLPLNCVFFVPQICLSLVLCGQWASTDPFTVQVKPQPGHSVMNPLISEYGILSLP